MGKETFGDIEIEENRFYHYTSPIFKKDVDIEKVLVSNKISFGEKTRNTLLLACIMIMKLSHYIHIMLPKTSVYVKRYDGQTKKSGS